MDLDIEYLYQNWEHHKATGGYAINGARGNKGRGTLEEEIEKGVLQFWLDPDPRGPGWGPFGNNPSFAEGYTGTPGQHYAGPGISGAENVRLNPGYDDSYGREDKLYEWYENDDMDPRRRSRGGRRARRE